MSLPGTDLVIPRNSIMSSANIALTQEHLIKSAIAVEEDVLSSELKKERKNLDTIQAELNTKRKEVKDELTSLTKAVVSKIGKRVIPGLKKLGFIGEFTMHFDGGRACDDGEKRVTIYVQDKRNYSLQMAPITEPTSKKVQKLDIAIKELAGRETKSRARIDTIMSELSDLSKKERRATAIMTLQQLGEGTDAGKQFTAMMEKVRAETTARLL